MSSGVAQDPGDTSYLHVFPHHPERPVDFTTLLRDFPALAQESVVIRRSLVSPCVSAEELKPRRVSPASL